MTSGLILTPQLPSAPKAGMPCPQQTSPLPCTSAHTHGAAPMFGCLMLSYMSSLYILDINSHSKIYFVYFRLSPYQNIVCTYLLPFSRWPFHFVDSLPCHLKAFQFGVVPFVYFRSCCPCLRRQIQKFITKTAVKEVTAFVFFWEFCGFSYFIQVFNPLS